MNKLYVIALITISLMLHSCVTTKQVVTIASLEGEWLIQTIEGEQLGESDKAPFIGFDLKEQRIFGTSGCNRMMGSFKQENRKPQSLILGPIATTMMMCPQMESERKVLNALNKVAFFSLSSDTHLTLNDKQGKGVATLQKR